MAFKGDFPIGRDPLHLPLLLLLPSPMASKDSPSAPLISFPLPFSLLIPPPSPFPCSLLKPWLGSPYSPPISSLDKTFNLSRFRLPPPPPPLPPPPPPPPISALCLYFFTFFFPFCFYFIVSPSPRSLLPYSPPSTATPFPSPFPY